MANARLPSMAKHILPYNLAKVSWCLIGCALWWIFLAVPAAGQTLLNGQVADAVTKAPIPGATVRLVKGDQELGSASSDTNGRFLLSCELPRADQPQNFTLALEHPEFLKISLTVQTVGGKFTQDAYGVQLLPRELLHCRPEKGHCVVIGYFTPPMETAYTDLSRRIADALNFDLLTRLQKFHLQSNLQPVFWACEEAKPRALTHGKYFAQALKADVFIWGNVKKAATGVDIRTVVSDSYGLFELPLSSINQNVDLNDPLAAQLHPETHAAVVAALAAGYEKEERFAQGIEATLLADKLLADAKTKPPELIDEIKKIRGRCQARLPHQQLLPGEGK